MCGIIYVKRGNKSQAKKTVIKRFNNQRARGTKGFGYIPVKDGKVTEVKRFELEADMLKELQKENTDEILFHHRYPTSTPNYKEVAHPISVESDLLKKNYYVIHNGMISNDVYLRKEHEEQGFEYTTKIVKEESYTIQGETTVTTQEDFYNDSEVFAIDLALYLEKKQDKIKARGSIAFICFETDKEGNIEYIHYGHNSSNPLVLEENKGMFVLKSVGHGKQIEQDVIVSVNYKTKEVTENNVNIGSYQRQPAGFNTNQYSGRSNIRSYEPDERVNEAVDSMFRRQTLDDDLDNDGYQRVLNLPAHSDKHYEDLAESYYDIDVEHYEEVEDEIERIKGLVSDVDKDIIVTEKFVAMGKTSEIYNEESLEEMEENKTAFEFDLIDLEKELSDLSIRLGGGTE